ncbi:hypothetical protein QBC32DRAFT_372722 [Pseudoneurospora amorphoporcata]|uniref:Uncharacterized protein n=1 Tax=Pseudoneurospora amorphoporcata TaxID=241081 RepID=A0AAN6SDU1_9PEZI|nr:hypothetical protein QBC32DRAFT_372722 [Pseudoneurospora amorphoporcata]
MSGGSHRDATGYVAFWIDSKAEERPEKAYGHRPTFEVVDISDGMSRPTLVVVDVPEGEPVLRKLLGLCSGHFAALCSAAGDTNLEEARPGRDPLLLSIPVQASCLTPLGKRRKRTAGRGAGAGRKLRRTLSGGRHVDGLFWCCGWGCCC